VRFYIPDAARWENIRRRTTGLGQYLTDVMRAVARENPKLAGVIDMVDFNATAAGQRIISDEYLAKLVDVLSRHRLGMNNVEPDVLGRAYEYLLRKFAEPGQSAGEFYTPREVAVLISRILEPEPGMTVYDPACGSGGLLIKCHLRLYERYGVPQNGKRVLPPEHAPLRLFGQEINAATFAMARMNAFIHDLEADIRIGDTMSQPAFRDQEGRLQRFDLVVANPMWNQKFSTTVYENDTFERFRFGVPPASYADWGWLQHMLASLNERGRMAVVLDTSAVSRGSGNQGSNRERNIRKAFVENDLIEAVVLLPENLFYNTDPSGIIIVINRRKARRGEILLINASKLFAKGRPKNYLTEEHIARIAALYHEWRAEEGRLRCDQNYLGMDGVWYTAIRVPVSSDPRCKKKLDQKMISQDRVKTLERNALEALHLYGRRKLSLEETLQIVLEYDELVDRNEKKEKNLPEGYRKTLEARPWEKCICPICSQLGIDVVIFRGANRNKRRGIHNTWRLYQKVCDNFDGRPS